MEAESTHSGGLATHVPALSRRLTAGAAMGFLRRLVARPDARSPTPAEAPPRPSAPGVGNDSNVAPPVRCEVVLAEVTRLNQAERFADAYAMVRAAVAEQPDATDLLVARALVLFSWGRLREALAGFLQAEAAGASTATLHACVASVHNSLGNPSEAEARARKAIAVDPRHWDAHYALGNALQAQGRFAEATDSFGQALEIAPAAVNCLINLANSNLARREYQQAATFARRALALDEFQSAAWTDLGVALAATDRHAEALDAFEHAQRLEAAQRQNPEISFNLAVALCHAGRLDDALDLYASTLAERPVPRGQYGYGEALLEAGRLIEGFANYEFRWMKEPQLSQRPHLGKPRWSGQDLGGKRILLISEQGFGDTFQFCRYARLVKALGAVVLVRTHGALKGLIETLPGIDAVSFDSDPVPDFDFYIHLASLPHVFGTSLDSIPIYVPYLAAPAVRVQRWSARLQTIRGARVGLVWAGNPDHERDRHRSVPPDALAALGGLDGVRFVSLQKPSAGKPDPVMPESFDCVDLGSEFRDFADTAAVIDQLDLVICVDTAVAHLAGALGKPVWLLIANPGEWRWMREREDSPWYPTMRIFRQRVGGDWAEVIGRVRNALVDAVAKQDFGPIRSGPPPGMLDADRGFDTLPAPGSGTRPGLCAVTEDGAGIIQYFPDEWPIGESLRWYGEYLHRHIAFLLRFVIRGSTVVEVDAAPGLHALHLSHAVGDEGHVMLYESRPAARWLLRQNMAVNRLANVTVMQRPLAGSAPEATTATEAPATETLDDLQLDRLDWLKFMDDASALRVLGGAAQSIWRLRPLIFVSMSEATRFGELANRLREFSYRCWRMEAPYFNPDNFNRRSRDVFDGGTVVALMAIPEETDIPVALDGFVEVT